MHTRSRCYHSTLLLGENRLITLGILRLNLLTHPAWQRSLAQTEERLLELLVRTVEEESQRTSTRSGVVDHLGTQNIVLAEVELVTNTDFTRRIDQHVPQSQLAIQLAEQENLDLGSRLLLVTVEACREHLRIVKDKAIALIEVVKDILERAMLDLLRVAMHDNHTRIVSMCRRILGYKLGRKFESVL